MTDVNKSKLIEHLAFYLAQMQNPMTLQADVSTACDEVISVLDDYIDARIPLQTKPE